MHVSNFLEILNIVKERALFSFSSALLDIIAQQILEELRGIRKLLSS